MQNQPRSYIDVRRELALELVNATEAAALGAARLLGRGDEERIHEAAGDAMRRMLDDSGFAGTVVLGAKSDPILPPGTLVGGGEPRLEFGLYPVEGAGAVMAAMPGSGIDAAVGIGGLHATLVAACAVRCLGGAMQARLWPRNDEERELLGKSASRTYGVSDLVPSAEVAVAITGITGGALLPGVAFGSGYAE